MAITEENSRYEMSTSLSDLRQRNKQRLSHRLLEKELELERERGRLRVGN